MKHLKGFNQLNEEHVYSNDYPYLCLMCFNLWDGDVKFSDAVNNAELSTEELKTVELFLKENHDFFLQWDGVPDPEDNETYKDMLETMEGAQILQKLIDAND